MLRPVAVQRTAIAPLAEVPMDSVVAGLPKVDLHVHQEQSPWLDRVLAGREGRAAFDWRAWAERLMVETPPGMARLARLGEVQPGPLAADAEPEWFVARLVALLEEAARDGAVLVEVRCGGGDSAAAGLHGAVSGGRAAGAGALSAPACGGDCATAALV